jgi:DNA repair protein RecN (Recombination protein N)
LLVDLHGQHHHQALLNPDVHGEYLDAWIGSAAAEASQKVQSCYRQYIATKSRLEVLRTNQRDRAQRLDILRFQFNEIRNFGIRDGELAELEGRISRLQNAEKISASLSMAKEVLRSGEVNAIDLLGQAIHELRVASVFDANITVMLTQIQEYQELLEQSAKEVESFLEENESDPESLEEHAARRDGLKRILKKYGDSEAEVLAHFEQISQELALLEGDGSDESELEKSLEYLTVQLQKACSELTSLREESKSEFARQVVSHLRELSMDRAEVEVAIKPADFGPNGADAIEFMFSANPGEPVKPLTKIASGGEISRVMLAIKCVMAGRAGTPSLLFDEVDTGLGGKAAAAVGKKLAELGRHYQVICISHLPQVASHAQAHLKIEKREVNGRTATSIQLLSEQERVHEIARMLAGETITENALNAAKDMLSLC